MGRGHCALARVAVIVRAPAAPLWWLGLLAAGIGATLPGLTGRRVGLLAGAALFLAAATAAFTARRKRYAHFAHAASRAGKAVYLQDRAVTVRSWHRGRRWWLALAFPAAVASSLVAPGTAGLAMAGLGAGLWAKAQWLGGLERRAEALLWVRTEWAKGSPAGKRVRGYLTTGLAAGDAAPGGARRPRHPAGRRPAVSAAR
ncbi:MULTISPECIES: hypothetical protein [Streptomyces]|uniref:hypothetical protein n=1 Tax=Streptomyces TaxID=1883 RepID=UPI00163D29B5|nr:MULTISPECIES: hypothetical protein [Streptomyces]MBC2879161.1 hypothetical protein [Streptomyces sp. TYQ1024]UBI38513.1 hypothetical protein K7I03_19980 [Streptomyces mobaraensis]UKW31097.1 hypothetical protein MCU78_19935 [Streptomyces sp. TYQ1024]